MDVGIFSPHNKQNDEIYVALQLSDPDPDCWSAESMFHGLDVEAPTNLFSTNTQSK